MSKPRILSLAFVFHLFVSASCPAGAPSLPPEAPVVVAAYADLVERTYREAYASAEALQRAVDAFLAEPDAARLAAARTAWLAARPAYGRSEAFRFYGGPIDEETAGHDGGSREGRLNAWPLNEAYIDAVAGAPESGLVNDPALPLTPAAVLERNARDDEADVTTGYHAIEFLLWGQDRDPTGAGSRPASDYLPGAQSWDRRRAYLRIVTDLLVTDLGALVDAWARERPGNYRARFLADDPAVSLGKILTGLATLSGFELAAERLGTALDSGDQEDEQSCFSDSTTADILANARGIAEVWNASSGAGTATRLATLVAGASPTVADRLDRTITDSVALAGQLDAPFDRTLASAPGSPERTRVEALITSLQHQAELLRAAGGALGVNVEIKTE